MGARGISDPLPATQQLFEEARAHFESLSDYKGEGFYGQAAMRAAKKAVQYGLPFPGFTAQAQQDQTDAVADAYRKASGR